MMSPSMTSMGCGLAGGFDGDIRFVCQYNHDINHSDHVSCPIPPVDIDICKLLLAHTLGMPHPNCPTDNKIYFAA